MPGKKKTWTRGTRVVRNGMAKFNPGEFVRQVRQEASKVTWPNRKEVGVTTAMVFIAVTLAAIFFLLVDLAANREIGFILGVLG